MFDTRILVTAYENPDLDGTACAFAYAEYLQRCGENASAGVFGTPHREARFVFERFAIPLPLGADVLLPTCSAVIIVDASDMHGISQHVNPSKVVKVIDHREVNEASTFPNAEVHIELVGAAATLVGEYYKKSGVSVSREAALALFFAIVSNTINFRARVTTSRDVAMARWLAESVEIPTEVVTDMFNYKSSFDKPLRQVLREDALATFGIGGKRIGIAQLEIVSVDRFVRTYVGEIETCLDDIRRDGSLDFVFLTCIDVEQGYNQLIATDAASQGLLEQALHVTFASNVAQTSGILMRKEIVPIMKRLLLRGS